MLKNKIYSSDKNQPKTLAECTIEMSSSDPSKVFKNRNASSSSSSSSCNSNTGTGSAICGKAAIVPKYASCSCSGDCVHFAAKNCNYEQIKELLDNDSHNGENSTSLDEFGRTPMHWLSLTECNCESCIDQSEACMQLLLNYIPQDSLDVQDNEGNTPLSLAVEFQNDKCVQLLLANGADYSIKNVHGETPLMKMVKKTPDIIVDLMNKAVRVDKSFPNSENCELKLNFSPVIGNVTIGNSKDGQRKELTILSSVLEGSKNSQNQILCHPLVSAFLDLKWKRVRKYFAFFFACYIFWLISYTSYIVKVYLVSCPCHYFSSSTSKKSEPDRISQMVDIRKLSTANSNQQSESELDPETCFLQTGLNFDVLFLLFLTFIMAFNEILKIILIPQIYFKSKLNYCSWILIASVLITTGPVIMVENSKPDPWQYQAAAFAIFISWAMILVQLGTFPSFGRYVSILGHVLKNFGLSMLTFASLFVAFALSFNVLFPGEDGAFSHFFYAILKVLVMMAGEVDYQDMFYDKENDSTKGPIIGHILYAAFVIIISIVLMNLLIGLTVSDIQRLQSEAEIRRIRRQIRETSLLETWAFSKKLPKCLRNFLSYDISVLKLPSKTSKPLRDGSVLDDRSISHPLLNNTTVRCRPNDKKDKTLPEEIKHDLLQIASRNFHNFKTNHHHPPQTSSIQLTTTGINSNSVITI